MRPALAVVDMTSRSSIDDKDFPVDETKPGWQRTNEPGGQRTNESGASSQTAVRFDGAPLNPSPFSTVAPSGTPAD